MDLTHPLNCLTFNFQRAARSLVRGFEAAVKAHGLSAPQFSTLAALSGYGEQTVSQLADKMGTERTTMTRNLEVMAAKGWIEPAASTDLRLRAYRLTEPGRLQLNRAMPAWHAYQAGLVASLDPGMAEQLLTTMKRL